LGATKTNSVGSRQQKSVLVLVSLLINVFYYAMDASDFGGIIDDFNKCQSAYLIIVSIILSV